MSPTNNFLKYRGSSVPALLHLAATTPILPHLADRGPVIDPGASDHLSQGQPRLSRPRSISRGPDLLDRYLQQLRARAKANANVRTLEHMKGR